MTLSATRILGSVRGTRFFESHHLTSGLKSAIPREKKGTISVETLDRFADKILPQIPKKWISHALGAAAHRQPPSWINKKLIQAFASFYQIDLSEVEKPLNEYASLGEFFTRKLKPGMRPIEGERIHPCDSLIIRSGVIHENTLIQAKGKTFQLNEFIPDNPWSEKFSEGLFATYYLAPHNYHRVHMPVSGKIQWVNVIPGELWPVNSWSVHRVPNLYCVNERVAVGIETEDGPCVVVLVGATNVGSITLAFDDAVHTNRGKQAKTEFKSYEKPMSLAVGDELGTFHLGSTAIVLYAPTFQLKPLKKGPVLLGQSL